MSKKRKSEEISLDIDIFDDPEKLEKALLQYVSPSNRRRAKKNEKKAKKIASSFMNNIEEDLKRQISDEQPVEEPEVQNDDEYTTSEESYCTWTTDESNTHRYVTDCGRDHNPYGPESIYPPIKCDDNDNPICPYCGKFIKYNDVDYDEVDNSEEESDEEETEEQEIKFPQLVYDSPSETSNEPKEESVHEVEESKSVEADDSLKQWFEFKHNRMWINDEYLGSKTFGVESDNPLVDGYYDDDTVTEILFTLFKIWVMNSRPDFIGSLSEIKDIISNPKLEGIDTKKIDMFVVRLFHDDNDLGYVYLETDEKLKNFMTAFDKVFEEEDNNVIVDLILRIGIYLNDNTFFDSLNEDEMNRFQTLYKDKDKFFKNLSDMPRTESDNNRVEFIENRSLLIDHLFELSGYEPEGEDEGVEHDHEPFPIEESDNNSSSEPEVNGSDSESESGDNPELDRDESAGTDGESGDVSSGEENEEIKEEEKVEEESDDESDIDLEKELEEGFDEVEKEN